MDCDGTNSDDKSNIKPLLDIHVSTDKDGTNVKPEVQYFYCSNCTLKEKFDYFGMNPPYTKDFMLLEDCYVIEDPFLPPKCGEFIILGSTCVLCNKPVCKDGDCSVYFDGTYCVTCARNCIGQFPQPLQDKINRIRLQSYLEN